MPNAEFDEHASTYTKLHKQNISLSGEEPAYFAEYKMRDFRALVDELGLPATGRYLDFGSGIGAAVTPFHVQMPDASLVCADVSAESLDLSRQAHGSGAEYARIEGAKQPFDDGEFDGAFACCVFHHIPHGDHLATLQELRRILKPNGLLMIYEHNPFNPLTVQAVRNCPFDEHAVLLTARQMLASSRSAGFNMHRQDYRVFFPSTLAWLRPLENQLRWLPLGAQYFLALRA